MAQLLGRAFIKVDGKQLRSNKGAKLDLGGVIRNPVVGNAVHGYSEDVKEAMIECEISLGKDDDLESIRNITNATIVFETDIGKNYIIRQAFLMEPPIISEGEGGKIPLKFSGLPAEAV